MANSSANAVRGNDTRRDASAERCQRSHIPALVDRARESVRKGWFFAAERPGRSAARIARCNRPVRRFMPFAAKT